MRIQLPGKVQKIIETLQAAGYEAYAVGGCIRDSILGKEPDDWDITTSANPQEVKKLFSRTLDTGIQHGTVTVMLEKEGFEVTTYRIDGIYEDGRHPKDVTYTSELSEDLKRRDFTINAIAYNEKDGLIDLFEGMQDIERGVIRCVGDPRERFSEDALRMMRAIRFSAQLGYIIEDKTKAAIKELAPNLQKISAERIQTELVKLLVSDNPDYLRTAYETGITAYFIPEFDICMETGQNNPHHCYSIGEHILHTLSYVAPDKTLRLGMLFHDIGKPQTLTIDEKGVTHNHGHAAVGEEMTVKILRRLKFSNDTIDKVRRIVRYHDYKIEPDAKAVRRAASKIGNDIFPLLFLVKYADIMAQSLYEREEKLQKLYRVKEIYEQIIEKEECLSLKDLAVSGRDLIAAGMEPGKEVGECLHKLLDIVLEHPEYNQKEYLLSILKI
ncbi:MAG: CCA tRNA nucleotidyltransferase [Blautia sp.]|nr:CCA tRNA nucleotidyltransferase [Lachnoclostridium sp.]MCM1212869.1 CCA tRNA nucleotidyltransferase [Blautia sp.]